MTCDVSVIIPAYNCGEKIVFALESVLESVCLPKEILVINDGSNDSTVFPEKKFTEKIKIAKNAGVDLRIITIAHSGVSAARNEGLKNASQPFIMFCDADDTVCPEWVEKLYNSRSEEKLVLCGYNESSRAVIPHSNGDCGRSIIINIFSCWLLNSCCNKIYSAKKIIDRKICFDEACDYGEDLYFNLEYFKTCDGFRLVKEALYDYTPSKSDLGKLKRFRRQKAVYKHLKNYLINNGLFSGNSKKLFYSIRRKSLLFELKN